MKTSRAALAAALALALASAAGSAAAADTGELWEVSSQMNMPGMPAGMGAQKSQLCRDKNEPPAGRSDCTVSNVRRSGLTESMTVSCPGQGEMQMEMTYNAARTEYKGVMRAKGGRGGEEMVINTAGRKLGACDPEVAKAKNQAAVAQMQRHQGDAEAEFKRVNDKAIADCAAAVETMRPAVLLQHKENASRQQSMKGYSAAKDPLAPSSARCKESGGEYCKRFRTHEGFLKTRRDERGLGARLCDVAEEPLRTSLCSSAVKTEDLRFAGSLCLAESASLGEKYCGGLDYTAVVSDKKSGAFCRRYLAYKSGKQDMAEDRGTGGDEPVPSRSAGGRAAAASAPGATPASAPATAPKPPAQPTDAATDAAAEAVNQGLNKLRGLFGR